MLIHFLINLLQFTYYGPDPIHKYLTLVVDDGIQPPVELSCKDRNIMAATFIRFLHKNIGKSETLAKGRNTVLCVTLWIKNGMSLKFI